MKKNDKSKKRIIGKPAIKSISKIASKNENKETTSEIDKIIENTETKQENSNEISTEKPKENTGRPEQIGVSENAENINNSESKDQENTKENSKEVETISDKPREKRKYTKRIKPIDNINLIKENKFDNTKNIQETPENKDSKLLKLEAKSTLYALNVFVPSVLSLFDKDLKENKKLLELNNTEINQLEQPLQSTIDYYDIKLNPLVVLVVMVGGIYANKIIQIKSVINSKKDVKNEG